jgi:hypothetical protein
LPGLFVVVLRLQSVGISRFYAEASTVGIFDVQEVTSYGMLWIDELALLHHLREHVNVCMHPAAHADENNRAIVADVTVRCGVALVLLLMSRSGREANGKILLSSHWHSRF